MNILDRLSVFKLCKLFLKKFFFKLGSYYFYLTMNIQIHGINLISNLV